MNLMLREDTYFLSLRCVSQMWLITDSLIGSFSTDNHDFTIWKDELHKTFSRGLFLLSLWLKIRGSP